MSTQKLPMVAEVVRLMPRIRATATTMPTAALTRSCAYARPAICGEIAHGGLGRIDCQLVLVVKLAAVFQARSGPTAASPCGFQGKKFCSRSMA